MMVLADVLVMFHCYFRLNNSFELHSKHHLIWMLCYICAVLCHSLFDDSYLNIKKTAQIYDNFSHQQICLHI